MQANHSTNLQQYRFCGLQVWDIRQDRQTNRLTDKAFNNSHRDTLKPPLAKISDDKIPLVLKFYSFNYKVIFKINFL